MNWNSFSLLGYLSVLLWLAVPLLWLMRKRSRRACPAALGLALVSLLLAKINSETHVDRIEPDRSAQVDEARAKEEAKLKAAEAQRGGEVADIRFAEDGSGDFLDKAGMDESDLKYMGKLDGSSDPEWKKTKKNRSGAGEEDGSLDSELGGKNAIEGVKTEALEEKSAKPPIFMSDADMAMAHRLDGLNLSVIQILILLAALMLFIDYLARSNDYAQAALPLPVPSAWRNAISPLPPVVVRSVPPRRDMASELAWLVKRGDCFIHLTENASSAPTSLPRLGKKWFPVEVLRVEGDRISDDFVFEALWFGRGCFVVDSPSRAERMVARFLELLEERKKVRARVNQNVHVVWDLERPLSERESEAFARLGQATGFSLFARSPLHPSV